MPELLWDDPPPGTRGFVLIVHAPYSRFGDFPHWVQFDIPADVTRLPEGRGAAVGLAGTNGFGRTGYGGPGPQEGEHRCVFDLYALNVRHLGLGPGASWGEVEDAMEDALLARASLMARCQRRQAIALLSSPKTALLRMWIKKIELNGNIWAKISVFISSAIMII